MPSYSMYLTLDHRLDCTKAKVQYTSGGDTQVFFSVEDPEFLTPRSCFNEVMHAVTEHQAVVVAERQPLEIVKDDDGA